MRLVLVGGGLAHIHFIRNLHQTNLPDVEVVFIHSEPHVFYPPAFISVLTGERSLQESCIDLRKISTLAGVTFVQDEVEFVHKEKKIIKFKNRASVQFDYLSLCDVQGEFNQHGQSDAIFYVKDFIHFFKKLQELEAGVAKMKPHPFHVALIGSESLGVALSFYESQKLRQTIPKMSWEMFEEGPCMLSDHHPQIRKKVEKLLKKRDVLCHKDFILEIHPENLLKDKKSKRQYSADVIFSLSEPSFPLWLLKSDFPLTEDGFIDSHSNFLVKSAPYIMAGGRIAGSEDIDLDARAMAKNLLDLVSEQEIRSKKVVQKPESNVFDLPNKRSLNLAWGFVRDSEQLWLNRQMAMTQELDHLRGVREQKAARFLPRVENKDFIEKLKNRLVLDINPKALNDILSEKLANLSTVDQWCEREYKDVFNDHYLSSFHAGLDILDQGYVSGGQPRYLRLYISSPGSMKDVEILSQIIIGAYRSVRDQCEFRVHICSQAMNTVQYSLGLQVGEDAFLLPEPTLYVALTQPLGLYGLLSQQGKDVWEGHWLSDIWPELEKTNNYLPTLLEKYRKQLAVMQLSEQGLLNDTVDFLGEESWRICINLRHLPRWKGVDHLLKQRPSDQLLERNWQKGFRYWNGQGEAMPESQYLLWEPHVVRPPACLLIDPKVAREIALDLKRHYGRELLFIGYAEKNLGQEQTVFKLSDWDFESTQLSSPSELTVDVLK